MFKNNVEDFKDIHINSKDINTLIYLLNDKSKIIKIIIIFFF